jgi:hypothetical protein
MKLMLDRDQFAALLVELDSLKYDWPSLLLVQTEMEDDILARIREVKPKVKHKLPPSPPRPNEISAENMTLTRERWDKIRALAYKVLGDDELLAIVDRYKVKFDTVSDEREGRRKALREQLGTLAATLAPRPGPFWTKADEVSESTYNSQTCPLAYARTSAELRALDFADAGLEVEVRHVKRELELEHPPVYRSGKFEVWVQAEALDVDIVKFGHGLKMGEWLQQVLSRSMNPRVLSPGLPWGLEERVGATYDVSKLRPVRLVEASA